MAKNDSRAAAGGGRNIPATFDTGAPAPVPITILYAGSGPRGRTRFCEKRLLTWRHGFDRQLEYPSLKKTQ